jgi:hypothetical protein
MKQVVKIEKDAKAMVNMANESRNFYQDTVELREEVNQQLSCHNQHINKTITEL